MSDPNLRTSLGFDDNPHQYTPVDDSIVNSHPKVYIYSLHPEPLVVAKGALGEFVIPPCEAGQKVSRPLVIHGKHAEHYDVGGPSLPINYVDGVALAEDIVGVKSQDRNLQTFTSNYEWYGVFISHSPNPSDKEIAAAREKRRARNLMFVAQADNFFLQGQTKEIDARHRKAAIEEKQKKSWAQAPTTLDTCPACGSQVQLNIAVCPNCTAVLNEQLARKYFPERFPAEPVIAKGK